MIKFFADSTMDISPEDVKKYDITLVPITVILGDTPYKDGYELNPEKIYDYVKETGNLPKTSACNAETYKEYWQPALDRGTRLFISAFRETCRPAAPQRRRLRENSTEFP